MFSFPLSNMFSVIVLYTVLIALRARLSRNINNIYIYISFIPESIVGLFVWLFGCLLSVAHFIHFTSGRFGNALTLNGSPLAVALVVASAKHDKVCTQSTLVTVPALAFALGPPVIEK